MATTIVDLHSQLIERSGLLAERDGRTRIAGRIFGLLLLSPDELSLEEIAERLSVSRASVSTDARRLLDAGIVERVGRPGDRRDYYRIAPRHFVRSLEHHLASVREFLRLIDDARKLSPASPEVRTRLEECTRAYAMIMHSITESLATLKGDEANDTTRNEHL